MLLSASSSSSSQPYPDLEESVEDVGVKAEPDLEF